MKGPEPSICEVGSKLPSLSSLIGRMAADDVGQRGQEGGMRLGEFHRDGAVVDGFHLGDIAELGRPVGCRLRILDPLEAADHVIGGHRAAVRERRTLADLEDIARRRGLLPAFRQRALERKVLVGLEQRLVDHLVHFPGCDGAGDVDVEAGDLGRLAPGDRLVLRQRRQRYRGDAESEYGGGGCFSER